jgi:hypothetical protein
LINILVQNFYFTFRKDSNFFKKGGNLMTYRKPKILAKSSIQMAECRPIVNQVADLVIPQSQVDVNVQLNQAAINKIEFVA